MKRIPTAMVASLVAGVAPQGARAAADAALPFAAKVESLIERGSIEGFDVSVARFASPLPPSQAAEAARREWRAGGAAQVLESASGGWRIVSRRDDGGYRTLQLRAGPDGGSVGLVSTWSSRARPASVDLDPVPLLPHGARVLRRFASIDGGRRAASVVAQLDGPLEWVAAALDDRLVRAGFERQPVVETPPNVAAGMARLYRGGAREALVTLHPHLGRTGLVVHLTEETK